MNLLSRSPIAFTTVRSVSGLPATALSATAIAATAIALGAALAFSGLPRAALAQTPVKLASYPSKPVTLVIPAAAGGGLDVSMRHVAKRLGEILATPVVVENRPSVNLLIGTRHVAAAPADGYTQIGRAHV